MSAGIKFYSSTGSLMIDSAYSNIALLQKVHIKAANRSGVITTNNTFNITTSVKEPIIVFPIDEVPYGVYSIIRKSDGNGFDIVAACRGNNDLKMFIFGKPEDVTTNGPALRIYSDIDGSKVFDSRLKYLKVIGEVVKGTPIPSSKNWGWLMRERQLEQQVVMTNPGSNPSGYHLLFLNSWYKYENKIEKNFVHVHGQYYSSLNQVPYYVMDPIRGIDPLLIDLGNF